MKEHKLEIPTYAYGRGYDGFKPYTVNDDRPIPEGMLKDNLIDYENDTLSVIEAKKKAQYEFMQSRMRKPRVSPFMNTPYISFSPYTVDSTDVPEGMLRDNLVDYHNDTLSVQEAKRRAQYQFLKDNSLQIPSYAYGRGTDYDDFKPYTVNDDRPIPEGMLKDNLIDYDNDSLSVIEAKKKAQYDFMQSLKPEPNEVRPPVIGRRRKFKPYTVDSTDVPEGMLKDNLIDYNNDTLDVQGAKKRAQYRFLRDNELSIPTYAYGRGEVPDDFKPYTVNDDRPIPEGMLKDNLIDYDNDSLSVIDAKKRAQYEFMQSLKPEPNEVRPPVIGRRRKFKPYTIDDTREIPEGMLKDNLIDYNNDTLDVQGAKKRAQYRFLRDNELSIPTYALGRNNMRNTTLSLRFTGVSDAMTVRRAILGVGGQLINMTNPADSDYRAFVAFTGDPDEFISKVRNALPGVTVELISKVRRRDEDGNPIDVPVKEPIQKPAPIEKPKPPTVPEPEKPKPEVHKPEVPEPVPTVPEPEKPKPEVHKPEVPEPVPTVPEPEKPKPETHKPEIPPELLDPTPTVPDPSKPRRRRSPLLDIFNKDAGGIVGLIGTAIDTFGLFSHHSEEYKARKKAKKEAKERAKVEEPVIDDTISYEDFKPYTVDSTDVPEGMLKDNLIDPENDDLSVQEAKKRAQYEFLKEKGLLKKPVNKVEETKVPEDLKKKATDFAEKMSEAIEKTNKENEEAKKKPAPTPTPPKPSEEPDKHEHTEAEKKKIEKDIIEGKGESTRVEVKAGEAADTDESKLDKVISLLSVIAENTTKFVQLVGAITGNTAITDNRQVIAPTINSAPRDLNPDALKGMLSWLGQIAKR